MRQYLVFATHYFDILSAMSYDNDFDQPVKRTQKIRTKLSTCFLALRSLAWKLIITTCSEIRSKYAVFLTLALILVFGVFFLIPRDDILLAKVVDFSNKEIRLSLGLNQDGQPVVRRSDMKSFARSLYLWGDFLTGTLFISAFVAFFGVVAKKKLWQSAAVAAILAATTAGLSANALRLTTGRPRPVFTIVADGFYGLRLEARYHAFPSGHSATALGTATALAVTVPLIGIPACVGAGMVMWSRMYLRAHRPADVWAGGMLGVIFGLAFGLAARRISQVVKKSPNKP